MVQPGDVIVAMWTAWWWFRAQCGRGSRQAGEQRRAKGREDRAKRLREGELGLDFYGLRAKLKELGVSMWTN